MENINARTISQPVDGRVRFNMGGAFIRVMEADVPVTIELMRDGMVFATLKDFLAGLAVEGTYFDSFFIVTESAGNVSLVVADAAVKYDRAVGSVTVANFPAPNGAFAHTQETVANASGQLLAANANRRYLLIQNNDSSGVIFVRLDGVAATTATGIKIAAGGSLELQGFVPTGEITAIGDLVSNANIVAVEG